MKNHNLLKIWKTFRILSISLCGKLFFLLLSRPHLIIGTVWATIEAIIASERRYPESHLGDNIANAYKHAVWNALIAYHTQVFYKKPYKATLWAKKVTDLHEECFPNTTHAKLMDLSNNEIGRMVYLNLFKQFSKRPHKKILLNHIAKQDLKTLS